VPTSSRIGGCTFAEDPGQSCAHVLPMWSAAVDPCVLAVRVRNPPSDEMRLFDAVMMGARILRGRHAEHLLIERGYHLFRFDVIEGTTAAGPVSLRFDIADDDRLPAQISVVSRFCSGPVPAPQHIRVAHRLLALQAVDTRDAGAGLREIAEVVLGPGAWPGNGEHRKSLVRRMIVAGDEMIRAGPAGALVDRPRGTWQLHPL